MSHVVFRYFEERPVDLFSIRGWRKVTKGTHEAVAVFWWKKFAKRHFQIFAAQRYGYQPRTSNYLARKAKEARRGKIPRRAEYNELVYSGETQKQILSGYFFKAYETRFTLQLQADDYITIRSRVGRPNMAAEITTIIPEEDARLRQVADVESTKLMAQNQRKNRIAL